MTTVSYPSATFPGLPSVRLEVPEDWSPVQAPGTVIAARAPVVPGEFTPNVVVSVEHREVGFTVERALDELARLAQERKGDISESFSIELGGLAYRGCDISWPDPDVERILQAHLLHVLEAPTSGGLPYLVQVTGSVGGERADEQYELLQQVMATVSLEPSQESREDAADGASEA